ncbi:hypothetical protein B9Z55_000925 [Caenorhabditis nigoni]|uniref:Uncharacterized protein n=1 Tax=Caenorhabditis nigoni TaxID=1611254 RepID=A0A2G5VVK7_9PELO|nr:hypothetical protein B9Z55_000925 [Caenorhabditis nigoni]
MAKKQIQCQKSVGLSDRVHGHNWIRKRGESTNLRIPMGRKQVRSTLCIALSNTKHTDHLYRCQHLLDLQRQLAHACYRQSFKVRTFSLLKLYMSARMDNPNEPMYQQVRVAECKEAVRLKQYKDSELVEQPTGVFRTANARDMAYNHTGWLGSSTYEHDEFVIVVGEVASFDGDTVLSTLGDTSKCSYSQGYCKNEETTIIWKESPPTRTCKYQFMVRAEALISDAHIAVPELRMFSSISQDMRRTEMEAKGCAVAGTILFRFRGRVGFPIGTPVVFRISILASPDEEAGMH